MAEEYSVWSEDGTLWGTHRLPAHAEKTAERARKACAEMCGTDGQELTPGRGDFACGTLYPHGVSIQVLRGGRDVSGDPTLNM